MAPDLLGFLAVTRQQGSRGGGSLRRPRRSPHRSSFDLLIQTPGACGISSGGLLGDHGEGEPQGVAKQQPLAAASSSPSVEEGTEKDEETEPSVRLVVVLASRRIFHPLSQRI